MPALSAAEVAAFLDEPGHLARIGTVAADGSPSVVPAWFVAEDGLVYVTPRERSAWFTHLRRDPRICISIDEDRLPYRKVTIRGSAEIVHDVGQDDAWRDRYRRIAERYVGPEGADRYLRLTWDEPRALLAVPVGDPTTWRMPRQDEDPTGVWAGRYWHG